MPNIFRLGLWLILAGVVAAACGEAGPGPGSGPPEEREAAPGFSVETFEGERFTLSEQRGTPVVLNFWESW